MPCAAWPVFLRSRGIMRRPWLIFTRRKALPAAYCRRTMPFGPGCMIRGVGQHLAQGLSGSLADFLKAIANSSASPSFPPSPAKGWARHGWMPGGGQGQENLERALQLRKSHFASDLLSLGRVYYSLGLASDMAGDREGALTAYAGAVDSLLKCVEGRNAGICWFSLICVRRTLCVTENNGKRRQKLLRRFFPCWRRGNRGRRITNSLDAVMTNWA